MSLTFSCSSTVYVAQTLGAMERTLLWRKIISPHMTRFAEETHHPKQWGHIKKHVLVARKFTIKKKKYKRVFIKRLCWKAGFAHYNNISYLSVTLSLGRVSLPSFTSLAAETVDCDDCIFHAKVRSWKLYAALKCGFVVPHISWSYIFVINLLAFSLLRQLDSHRSSLHTNNKMESSWAHVINDWACC